MGVSPLISLGFFYAYHPTMCLKRQLIILENIATLAISAILSHHDLPILFFLEWKIIRFPPSPGITHSPDGIAQPPLINYCTSRALDPLLLPVSSSQLTRPPSHSTDGPMPLNGDHLAVLPSSAPRLRQTCLLPPLRGSFWLPQSGNQDRSLATHDADNTGPDTFSAFLPHIPPAINLQCLMSTREIDPSQV